MKTQVPILAGVRGQNSIQLAHLLLHHILPVVQIERRPNREHDRIDDDNTLGGEPLEFGRAVDQLRKDLFFFS